MKSLIEENKIEEALDQILSLSGLSTEINHTCINLKAQLKHLERDRINQTISDEDYAMSRSRINISVLKLIEELDQLKVKEKEVSFIDSTISSLDLSPRKIKIFLIALSITSGGIVLTIQFPATILTILIFGLVAIGIFGVWSFFQDL